MKKFFQAFVISLTLLASGIVLPSQTFGYLEDKIYCEIKGEQLTLYVKKEEGLNKCDTYLQAIQQLARVKYDEVLLVLDYINQWDDRAYREGIFELKKQEFLKLVKYRTTIQTMLQEFEQKFLVKYQDSLRQSLAPYLQSLEKIKETFDTEHLTAPSDEKIHIFSQQISKQIKVVHAILYATTLEEIMENIPNYLYLKQQLVWK